MDSRVRAIVGMMAVALLLALALVGGLRSQQPAQASAPQMPEAFNWVVLYETATTTIVSGSATSSAGVDLAGGRLVAVAMPEAWTAAALSLQGSVDGVNYYDVYDGTGNEVTFTVAASRHVVFDDLSNAAGLRWVKVRSGTTGTPVTQASTRTITLTVRP